jgi:hypothetical protein
MPRRSSMADDETRPAIPAGLKRQILVEAGHRCAIPTCRSTQVEIAHIIPWSEVHEHKYENLIALCPNCHTRFDHGEIDRQSMYLYKAQLRFLTDRYTQLELDILEELAKHPENSAIPFVLYMSILIKRILEEELVVFSEPQVSAYIKTSGVRIQTSPSLLAITEKGRQFIRDMNAGKSLNYEGVVEK